MSKMMVDVTRYTYRVTWSVEDEEFVATCLEFPSLSWLAATQRWKSRALRARKRLSIREDLGWSLRGDSQTRNSPVPQVQAQMKQFAPSILQRIGFGRNQPALPPPIPDLMQPLD